MKNETKIDEVYGIGFSLGANHIVRYVGDSGKDCKFKAAVSVSNPFCLVSTGVML